jgi:hypothetical protein
MLTFVLILAACLNGNSVHAQDSEQAKPAAKSATAGPENVLREFLLALGTLDEKKLRSISLPHDGFEMLLKGQAVPEEARMNFETFVKQTPIRALKAGDTLNLPGGRTLKVDPADVSEENAMLMFGRDPLPHRFRKVNGDWKIDPSSIISARKAAEAARKKKAAQ